jgi:pimeloyl-ACP methyl ester carboxylesterase
MVVVVDVFMVVYSTTTQKCLTRIQQTYSYTLMYTNAGDNHHDWRDSMNYSEMAQDLLAFLDAHNIPKAVLVGHSMGGKVCITCNRMRA